MALDKQIHLYSIDTSRFYNDKEFEIASRKMEYTFILNKHKAELNKLLKKKYKEEQWEEEFEDKIEIKRLSNVIGGFNKLKKNESELLDLTIMRNSTDNIFNETPRELDYRNSKKDNFLVSEFISSVTRSFGIKENEITDDIIIVRVYYVDLFEDLLYNGFMYNGKKYIYYSSSAGQIRTKKAVFVSEDKWNENRDRLLCGLSEEIINSKGGCNTNKFLAYTSLSNSATELWYDIFKKPFDIDKCIVVDDFETMVNTTYDYVNSEDFSIQRITQNSLIPHMDGCGMISSELSKKNFMVRMPWVKGLLASFDFNKFIDRHKCSSIVKDIYGIEHDIIKENIQIILTKSQFKMYKYYDSWEQYKELFKKHNCECGICNMEETDIKNSRINYQMLQTLTDIKKEEMDEMLKSSNANIKKLSNDFNHILRAFGVNGQGESGKYKSNLQNALTLYPELMKDPYVKDTLYDIKKALLTRYKGGKLEVNGKYIFIIPDLYAFCEWLFLGIENPNGLIKNGQVSCKIYKDKKKLDLLRAPHLYREHAIRENIHDSNEDCRDWFNTSGVYVSILDPISKILVFDVDGDKSLVVSDDNFVKIAERNMKGIVPLLYDLKKAEPSVITVDSKYKGLTSAFKANIGTISNNITKVWNSGKVGKRELNIIKWLCALNNAEIDYAKTLWRPTIPKDKKDIMKEYVGEDVPYFFTWAKDKKKENVSEPVEGTTMYRIYKGIKDVRLSFSCFKNLEGIDYKLMMYDEETKLDTRVVELYDKLCLSYNSKLSNLINKDNDNLKTYIKLIKDAFAELGYLEIEIADILTIYLYKDRIDKIKGKQLYWYIYGDYIVDNLKENLKREKQETIVCECCGKRDLEKKIINGKCKQCRDDIKNVGIKKVICMDCGKEFEVESKGRTKRCDSCKDKFRKQQKLESWHKNKEKYKN